jgi:hypothetical protein
LLAALFVFALRSPTKQIDSGSIAVAPEYIGSLMETITKSSVVKLALVAVLT